MLVFQKQGMALCKESYWTPNVSNCNSLIVIRCAKGKIEHTVTGHAGMIWFSLKADLLSLR